MLNRLTVIFCTALLSLSLWGCAPREVTVTRVVEFPVTVQVTSPPLVTRVVETETIEVTRLVPAQTGSRFTGRLVVAIGEYPNSLDLPQVDSAVGRMVAWQLYDSLVAADAQGNIVPALAERWEISEDGTVYTFHLRFGVKFHNGEPFTADTVRFSWERGRNPANVNDALWNNATNVEVVDDYTVRITTAEPIINFLRLMADNWAMVPPAYIAQVGEAGFASRPVGTGPFAYSESEPNGFITLEANPTYWDSTLPKLRTITFRWVGTAEERLALLREGRVHIVSGLEPVEAMPLLSTSTLRLIGYPQDRLYFIAFNRPGAGEDSPLEDARVRLAMNYAINRTAMVSTLFGGLARLSTGFVPISNLGADPTLLPIPYDRTVARSLLAEAGYADGFEIEMACPEQTYPQFDAVCEWVKADLAEVGIVVNLTFISPDTYFDLQADRALPALFGDRRTGDGTEALSRLNGLLGGSDYASWYEDDISSALGRIRTTVDPAARTALYVDLQALMQENPPFIYLYEPLSFDAVNAAVQNYTPRVTGVPQFKAVSLLRP